MKGGSVSSTGYRGRGAQLLVLLLFARLLGAAAAGAVISAPLPVADANCDGRGSAADFTAAVIVSGDGAQFPSCAAADPFRDRMLQDADFVPILHDLFDTFTAPRTATPTVSATVTGTPTITGTRTRTPLSTPSPTTSVTPTPTGTATPTPTQTPTETATFGPTHTASVTPTPRRFATSTATPTRTPTGLAYQLSGDWFANWTGQICFLAGQPFTHLTPTTYRVTAIAGTLDIALLDGTYLGRGLVLDRNNTVVTQYRVFSGNICRATGVDQEYVFNYAFTFGANGFGSAKVDWNYGFNTNCAVCSVTDTATLIRVAGPGTQSTVTPAGLPNGATARLPEQG